MKLTSEHIAEYDRFYHPKHQIVTKKPVNARDGSEIWMQNPDGSYHTYKMIQGKWINTAKNLTE